MPETDLKGVATALMVVAFTVRHFRPSANLESTSPAAMATGKASKSSLFARPRPSLEIWGGLRTLKLLPLWHTAQLIRGQRLTPSTSQRKKYIQSVWRNTVGRT